VPPRCEVGLQLRSLSLDDPACSLTKRATLCKEAKRRVGRLCLPDSIGACPGDHRFATSDDPSVYRRFTRSLGWSDLDETAVRTVTDLADGATTNSTTAWAATVMAWMALRSCTRAIVAPVPSQFSHTAALAAGIPVAKCCSQVLVRGGELRVEGKRPCCPPAPQRGGTVGEALP